MSKDISDQVVARAAQAHQELWASGTDVGAQTKRSHAVCRAWQNAVKDAFPNRFEAEHGLNETGRSHQIDLVDTQDHVAYELKASPNNVHMEIYRDVFKALVFNRRNPELAVKKLIFIAPQEGIDRLRPEFQDDVTAILQPLGLGLELHGIPTPPLFKI